MSAILDKQIVLKLNSLWQAVATRTVRDAITDLTSESDGRKPALALDITYPRHEDGSINYDLPPTAWPLEWDEWIKLPVRPEDLSIQAGRGLIRVPTVLVCCNYAKMPMRKFKPNRRSVYERDKGVCQVTGRFVGWKGGNLDHIVSKARLKKQGVNPDTFENLVWMDADLNTRKGDRPLAELGMKLIRKPVAPKEVPVCRTFSVQHPTWTGFLD